MEVSIRPLRPFSCRRGTFPRLRWHRSAAPCLRARSVARSVAKASAELSWEGGEVDVIGIGSRRDDIIDFCLDSSPSSSSLLRFWTIQSSNASKLQLQRRSSEGDMEPLIVDLPLCLHSCCRGIILVASAGYGPDGAVALELLDGVKSTGGLSVTILLKPFCFEGQRRQQEVDNLRRKLQSSSQLYLVVETDALLRTNVETLAEAVKIVNYAVLLAINMISTLMNENHAKFLDVPDQQMKEFDFAEIVKLLGNYGESKFFFGKASDVKSSMMQAISNAPFLANDMKGANSILMLTVACAARVDKHDLEKAVCFFRRITNCDKNIIVFGVHKADMDREVVIALLLEIGCHMQRATPKNILSGFFGAIPFLRSFLRRNFEATEDASIGSERPLRNNEIPSDDGSLLESNAHNNGSNFLGLRFEVGNELHNLCNSFKTSDAEDLEERLNNWTLGPAFDFAQKWAKERATLSGTSKMPEGIDIFTLPAGVKRSVNCHGDYSSNADSETLPVSGDQTGDNLSFPAEEKVVNTNMEILLDNYGSGLSPPGAKDIFSRRPRELSIRAASMLEAERESEKKWAPSVEMEYKGGLYKGRCQGGLPEGKGYLAFNDGSFYYGSWQYGKRSGSGTFCHTNGDIYQGAWRDDFIHGKGWFYFHTGDRWFANFWKGKASGEGRFYSKSGSVFFGHFQNGWRHGEGLYIDADGSRWSEFWEEGILVRKTELPELVDD